MKPGSAGPGVPGIHPIIYDEEGKEIPPRSGRPETSVSRTLGRARSRRSGKTPIATFATVLCAYCKNRNSKDWRDWPYMAGDGAVQAADGYYRILGRIDDVINVAGHRLGTKEIESASLLVEEVAEAAVVPAGDEIKGKVPDLYVSLKPGYQPSEDIVKRVEESRDRDEIGHIARPRRVMIVPDMPKTRSGKIMRRVLAAISNNMKRATSRRWPIPKSSKQIRVTVQGKDPVELREGPEDVKRFGRGQ